MGNHVVKALPIWDLPLRLFHWSLAIVVSGAVATALVGGNAMEWHALLGFATLALLVFRLLWGFCGGTYARFAHCVPDPKAIAATLRGAPQNDVGHTPLGKVALIFILGTLWFQAVSGLFANDDIDIEGPLFDLVSKATSDWLTGLHKGALYVIGALIAVHVLAILFYHLVKKKDLVGPMLRGWRHAPADTPDDLAARGGSTLLGLILMAISGGLVWYIVEYF